jgi:hypothetical protein
VFVVRHNNEQFLIRTPALVGDFDQLVNARNDAALLETLLSSAVTTPYKNKEEVRVVTVDEQKPVPAHRQALGRNEGADLASASAGTGQPPSQGVSKRRDEIEPSQGFLMPGDGDITVPRLSDALGRNASVPVPDRPEPAKSAEIADFGGFSERGDGDGGDDALLAALAALQRAGVSREQARALGLRFRNNDWARAARLNSED